MGSCVSSWNPNRGEGGPLVKAVVLQGEDVDGALVGRTAEPLIPQAKVDAVQGGLICTPPQFNKHYSCFGVPNSYESALYAGTRNHCALN